MKGRIPFFSLYPRMWSKDWVLLGNIFQSNVVKKASDKLNCLSGQYPASITIYLEFVEEILTESRNLH